MPGTLNPAYIDGKDHQRKGDSKKVESRAFENFYWNSQENCFLRFPIKQSLLATTTIKLMKNNQIPLLQIFLVVLNSE